MNLIVCTLVYIKAVIHNLKNMYLYKYKNGLNTIYNTIKFSICIFIMLLNKIYIL